MSPSAFDLADRFRDNTRKQVAIRARIADAARAVIPVLLDAGRVNSAKELQELYFELDAEADALKELVQNSAFADALAILMNNARRPHA